MSVAAAGLVITLAALAAAIAYAHFPALAGLKALWDATPMYSFGYVVPFVSAALAWHRRDRLPATLPGAGWLAGGLVLGVAVVLLVAGRLGSIQVAEQLALVAAAAASVLIVGGWASLRVLWFPLAYLLLLVPFWDGLTEPLHQPFQTLSATIGVWILQALHIPAYREGVHLYLSSVTLHVARACSGVNYLVAVLALGIPMAATYLQSAGRQVLLVVAAVGIAALSNSLRVALIGTLAHLDLGVPLHGPAHVLQGLFVSGIGFVAIFVGLRWLAEPAGKTAAAVPAAGPPWPWRAIAARTSAIVAVYLCVGTFLYTHETREVPPRADLSSLPLQFGDWVAEPAPAEATPWWHGADDELFRRYRRGAEILDVSVGYYRRQSQGRELAGHEASGLWRSAGGTLPIGTADGAVFTLRGDAGAPGRAGVFWYDVDHDLLRNPYAVKVRTLLNAVVHGRSNGTIVVVLSTSDDAGRVTAAAGFLVALRAALQDILPGPAHSTP